MPEPLAGLFDDAVLGSVVDVNEAEAGSVAFGPLEIIEQGPDEVPGQIDAFGLRLTYLLQALHMVGRAGGIDHLPLLNLIVKGCAAFGHNQFMGAVVQAKLPQNLQHAAGVHLPPHLGNGFDTPAVGDTSRPQR